MVIKSSMTSQGDLRVAILYSFINSWWLKNEQNIIKPDVHTHHGVADMVLESVMDYIIDDVIRLLTLSGYLHYAYLSMLRLRLIHHKKTGD